MTKCATSNPHSTLRIDVLRLIPGSCRPSSCDDTGDDRTNSWGDYSGYGDTYAPGHPSGAEGRHGQVCWLIVGSLGIASFGVSVGSPVLIGWPVWFSVLAAVIAAVGLLPGQQQRGWIVVALAVTGFLSALSLWITGAQSDWAIV